MHVEKKKIRRIYYIGSISSVLLVAMIFSLVFVKSLNDEHREKIEQLATGIINEKQRFLQNAVDRTINLIESERELVKNDNKDKKLSSSQIEKVVIKRISTQIRNLRLIDDGYIWVNRIVNYEGGDNYAIREIHPNLPQTEGMWLSTNTTDIKGKRPYEAELNGIKKDGELFYQYYFKQLKSDQISHKMSYAKLYKPYDWVVATGVYLDDVDKFIEIETNKMQESHNKRLFFSLAIASFATFSSICILAIFEKQIRRLIDFYENEVAKHTHKLIEEHEKTSQALAEVKQLKGLLPICASCKKIRDDKGYWNQIESYLKTYSDVSFTHGICPQCYEKEIKKIDASKKKRDMKD